MMGELDKDDILSIKVRISAAFLDFHHIHLRPPAYGSDLWTLTVGSNDYLGCPDYTMPGPAEVGGFPSRATTLRAERVGPILRRLAGLALSVEPPYTGGLDGDSFEVTFQRGLSYVEYSWWSDVPAAWEPLGVIVDELLTLVGEPRWPRCRGRRDVAL